MYVGVINNKDLSFKSGQYIYCIFSFCVMLTETVYLKTLYSLCSSVLLCEVEMLLAGEGNI